MKKRLITMLLAVSLTLTFVGCGGSGSSGESVSETRADESEETAKSEEADSKDESDAAEKETVKWAVSTYNMDWVNPVAEAFEKENPNIDVEIIEVSGNDMTTKLTMMMQSEETAPDLIAEDGFMVKADVAAGYLEPLDEMLAGWDDYANFVPAVLEGGRGGDGKQYGIPYSTDVQGLWYAKPLFEQAGLPVPFEPKTWEDILDAARKLKETVGESDFIPLAMFNSKSQSEATSQRTFQNLYFGTGGELYDFDEQKWIVDEKHIMEVLNFLDTVYNKEGLGGPIGTVSATNFGDVIKSDYMKNGKVGMFISSDGILSQYKEGAQYEWLEAMDTWAFANIPTINGEEPGSTTIAGGWTWGIPSKAANKEGGFELLKFAVNQENHKDFCIRYGLISVRSDVAADEDYLNMDMKPVKEATKMVETAHFRPAVEGYASVTSLYTDMVEAISTGVNSPEEALEAFKDELIRTVGEDAVRVE